MFILGWAKRRISRPPSCRPCSRPLDWTWASARYGASSRAGKSALHTPPSRSGPIWPQHAKTGLRRRLVLIPKSSIFSKKLAQTPRWHGCVAVPPEMSVVVRRWHSTILPQQPSPPACDQAELQLQRVWSPMGGDTFPVYIK